MFSSQISRPLRIEEVVRSASRRRVLTLATEQFALALAFVFGGVILLLVAGTQLLEWYWLVLLSGIGLGLAAFRILDRRLTPYRIAQLLDRRLQLSDSLSTAWFLQSAEGRTQNSVAQLQIARAEDLANSVRVSDAFPFSGRRAWALTAVLAGVALSLFAVRYLVTSSLSLHQTLIPIQLVSVFERGGNPGKDSRIPDVHLNGVPARPQADAKLGSLGSPENTRPADASFPQDAMQNNGDAAVSAASENRSDKPQGRRAEDGRAQGQQGDGADNGTKSASQPASANQGDSRQKSNSQNPLTGEQQEPAQGLVDKMKDALSSLMAKMRPGENSPASSSQQRPNGDRQNAGKDSPSRNSENKNSSGQQQNAANQQSNPAQNLAGQAQGQTKEKAQPSSGQNSDQSPQQGTDAHSGIGRQDGDKGLKEADQLRAMGKLEEIIGKRSENLTGEMTVETPSNKQQLRTAYSQRLGHHSDAGGEINRDEIPLDDQQYVREYMEQVRKQGAKSQ